MLAVVLESCKLKLGPSLLAGRRLSCVLAALLCAALASAQVVQPQDSGNYYITVFPNSVRLASTSLASAAGAQQAR
jgi:hypothetical protein